MEAKPFSRPTAVAGYQGCTSLENGLATVTLPIANCRFCGTSDHLLVIIRAVLFSVTLLSKLQIGHLRSAMLSLQSEIGNRKSAMFSIGNRKSAMPYHSL